MAKNKEKGRNLTLSIKRRYFYEILSGEKVLEERQIWPDSVGRYCEPGGDGWTLLDGNGDAVPQAYDTITFLTGAYRGTRPRMVAAVRGAAVRGVTYAEVAANGVEMERLEGETEDDVATYEDDGGRTCPVLAISYELGEILERPAEE